MTKPKATYEEVDTTPRISPLVPMPTRDIFGTLVAGLVTGLTVAGVMMLLNTYVFGAALCRPQSIENCNQAPFYSMIVAIVVGVIVGVVLLARMRIYRPLMIVLAVAIATWGIHAITSGMAWYWTLIAVGIIYATMYGFFAWMARVRSFMFALVLTVVMVVVFRLVMVS